MNNTVVKSIPRDPLYKPGFFYSTNLSLIGSILLLSPEVRLDSIEVHPIRPAVKVYYLSPESIVKEYSEKYRSEELRVDPSKLALEINKLRTLPVTKGGANG